MPSEADLERYMKRVLGTNQLVPLNRCFRGGGCWPHNVPEVCLEIVNRAEFRTAYWGSEYTDHGKWQAFFEYASLLGELLEMDAVSLPTYDWANAAASSVRMACRITGRHRVVVAGEIGADGKGVDEEANQVLQFGATATGDGRTDQELLLAGVAE